MSNIVVVCQEEHEKGYEDYVGVCLLCEIERAVLAEREACAKVADHISDKYSIGYYGSEVDAIDEVADAIRERGVQKYEPCPFVECDCDGNHPAGQEAIRARGQQ